MKPESVIILPLVLIGAAVMLTADSLSLKAGVIAIIIIILTMFFFFRRTIWLWWYTKVQVPQLDPMLRKALLHQSAYFRGLSVELKQRFEQRLFIYLLSIDFEKRELKTLAEEVKGLVAAQAVMVTFGFDDDSYLMTEFSTWAFYPTPFLTPDIQEFHTGEVYQERYGSCMMLAADSVVKSFGEPNKYYNIALHELANVLRLSKNITGYDKYRTNDVLERLSIVRGATYDKLLKNTGKPRLDFFAQCTEHLFYNPVKFKELLPDLYQFMQNKLQQNPLNTENPLQ